MTNPTSTRALALWFGHGRSTIHRKRAQSRTPDRVVGLDGKRYPWSRDRYVEQVTIALRALADGRTVAEVAATADVSERTVRRWRRENGGGRRP